MSSHAVLDRVRLDRAFARVLILFVGVLMTFSKISRFATSALCVSLLAALPACSSKGKGKPGEGGLSEAELAAQRESRFGEGSIPTAEGESGPFRSIHFDYDSSSINSAAQHEIEHNAEVMRQNPAWSVVLEGHCDDRGTAEYNMALGAARARAVRDMLVSLGVDSNRLDTISYGEEVPVDPSHSEEAWSRNRRVHPSVRGNNAGNASYNWGDTTTGEQRY